MSVTKEEVERMMGLREYNTIPRALRQEVKRDCTRVYAQGRRPLVSHRSRATPYIVDLFGTRAHASETGVLLVSRLRGGAGIVFRWNVVKHYASYHSVCIASFRVVVFVDAMCAWLLLLWFC